MNILFLLKLIVGYIVMNNPFGTNEIYEIANKIEEIQKLLTTFIELHKGYEIEILKELNQDLLMLYEKLKLNDENDEDIENDDLSEKFVFDAIRSKIISIQAVLERYRVIIGTKSDDSILLLENKISFLLILIT